MFGVQCRLRGLDSGTRFPRLLRSPPGFPGCHYRNEQRRTLAARHCWEHIVLISLCDAGSAQRYVTPLNSGPFLFNRPSLAYSALIRLPSVPLLLTIPLAHIRASTAITKSPLETCHFRWTIWTFQRICTVPGACFALSCTKNPVRDSGWLQQAAVHTKTLPGCFYTLPLIYSGVYP